MNYSNLHYGYLLDDHVSMYMIFIVNVSCEFNLQLAWTHTHTPAHNLELLRVNSNQIAWWPPVFVNLNYNNSESNICLMIIFLWVFSALCNCSPIKTIFFYHAWDTCAFSCLKNCFCNQSKNFRSSIKIHAINYKVVIDLSKVFQNAFLNTNWRS